MNKNINQLLIKVILKGDVSGTLPVFNYNYNILNKNLTKGGNIYIPNRIALDNDLFKIKNQKNKEITNKLRLIFTSEEALNNLYKENSNKIEIKSNELIKKNLSYIIKLFFQENEDFYLDGKTFKISSVKDLTTDLSNNNFEKSPNNILLSKNCSSTNIPNECTIANLENQLIESYKEKEIKFIKKIDPNLIKSEIDKKAYRAAIEKYRKGNELEQIKNFANEIIQKENNKNDYKKAGIKYIFDNKKGIILNSNVKIIDDITIELNLTYKQNIKLRKKLYIESGNCKTKKNYIKHLWKKFTRKNVSTSKNKEMKWVYKKDGSSYKLNLI